MKLADGEDRLADVHNREVHDKQDSTNCRPGHLLHAIEAQGMTIGDHSSELMLVAPHWHFRCE
eukprot:12170273-Heterocapsa_arctica.AAC.1